MPVARSLPSDLTGSVTSVRIASKAAKAAKAAIGYLEPAGPLAREDVVRELTFTARTFAAEEALAYGFATRLEADRRAAALATAREIAGRSPHAIRAAKRSTRLSRAAARRPSRPRPTNSVN